MDSRRPMRGVKAINGHQNNGGGNRPYVKMDRITQIPSPFHHNRPSPYSRRMPPCGGPMQMVGSPYQIFSPRTMQLQQTFPGLPPVPPYPFHNMDLTPRRRQGPVTRSKSAVRPQNKQSRLSIKPAPRPQLSARTSLGPKQEKIKPVETKPQAKQAKPVEKPAEKLRRESLRPDTRRRSLAPVRTDFIEKNKANAGRRKSVDPTTLKDMKTTRRQSLARTVKAVRVEKSVEPEEIAVEEQKIEVPILPMEVVAAEVTVKEVSQQKEEQLDDEAKENIQEDETLEEAISPKRAKLEKLESDEENKSPKQTTSLFLQYLDIKKDDLPAIVADYDSQQAVSENSKQSKKSRCAIM